MNTVDTNTINATVKGLKARLRKVAKADRRAHWQIADRMTKNASLLADANPERAAGYCWDARFHLNHCEG